MTSLVLTPQKVKTNIPRMREKESRSSLPYKTHLSAIDGLENKQTRAEHTHTRQATLLCGKNKIVISWSALLLSQKARSRRHESFIGTPSSELSRAEPRQHPAMVVECCCCCCCCCRLLYPPLLQTPRKRVRGTWHPWLEPGCNRVGVAGHCLLPRPERLGNSWIHKSCVC